MSENTEETRKKQAEFITEQILKSIEKGQNFQSMLGIGKDVWMVSFTKAKVAAQPEAPSGPTE